MVGMKDRLWFWLANILFAGCSGGDESGGPAKLDLEYPEPLAGIIDKAVDVDELDDSQLKDDFFSYSLYEPNDKTPDSGWIKRIFRGKVTLLAEVEDGTLNGTSILFDEDGSKSSESTYLRGVLHGPHAEFLPDGGKILEGAYRAGKEQGPWRYWRDDGTLERDASYDNGEQVGSFTKYHPNGSKAMEGNMNGPITKWFDDNKTQAKGTFLNGKLHGSYTEWNRGGTRQLDATYEEGNLHGPYARWFDATHKSVEGVYKDDKQDGVWTHYHPPSKGGSPRIIHTFDNGKTVKREVLP